MKEFYFTAALKSFIYRNDSEALKISNYPPHLLLIFAFLSMRRKKIKSEVNPLLGSRTILDFID